MTDTLTFEQACETVMQHIEARNWDKTNTSRGIAISIALEAAELLEYFQQQEESFGRGDDMASELADVFIYGIQFARMNNIDIPLAIQQKIEKMEKKYPVELFEIEDEKKRKEAWLEAKINYKKDTTLQEAKDNFVLLHAYRIRLTPLQQLGNHLQVYVS